MRIRWIHVSDQEPDKKLAKILVWDDTKTYIVLKRNIVGCKVQWLDDEDKEIPFEYWSNLPVPPLKKFSFCVIKDVRQVNFWDFQLHVRARNVLENLGIKTLGALCNLTAKELFLQRNVGRDTVDSIQYLLSLFGLELTKGEEDSYIINEDGEEIYSEEL